MTRITVRSSALSEPSTHQHARALGKLACHAKYPALRMGDQEDRPEIHTNHVESEDADLGGPDKVIHYRAKREL